MPATAIGLALILGATLSRVAVTHGSLLEPVAYTRTEADARPLIVSWPER